LKKKKKKKKREEKKNTTLREIPDGLPFSRLFFCKVVSSRRDNETRSVQQDRYGGEKRIFGRRGSLSHAVIMHKEIANRIALRSVFYDRFSRQVQRPHRELDISRPSRDVDSRDANRQKSG